VRQESAELNVEESTISSTVPSSSIKEVDSSLPSKEVTIETENYRLVIDTKGGIGKSLQET